MEELPQPLIDAANPETPVERLEELYRVTVGTSSELPAVLAGNPSTPARLLVALASDHPAEVLQNPVLLFSQLGGTNILGAFPRETLGILCRVQEAPAAIRNYWLNHAGPDAVSLDVILGSLDDLSRQMVDAIHEYLARGHPPHLSRSEYESFAERAHFHPYCSTAKRLTLREVLQPIIQQSPDRRTRALLGLVADFEHRKVLYDLGSGETRGLLLADTDSDGPAMPLFETERTGPVQATWWRYASWWDKRSFTLQLLSRSDLTTEQLDSLMGDGSVDAEIRRLAASHPAASEQLLTTLYETSESAAVVGVLRNPKSPASFLAQGARSTEFQHRLTVAKNPQTHPMLLGRLFMDQDPDVRCAAAANANLPSHLLTLGAADPDAALRSAVAVNPNCPQRILDRLAKDAEPMVRKAVASRLPPLEGLVLAGLAHDRVEAARLLDDALTVTSSTRRAATQSWLVKPKFSSALSKLLFYGLHASPEQLYEAAKTDSRELKMIVALNPRTPESLRDKFRQDLDQRLRISVADSHAEPGWWLNELAQAASEA